MELFQNRDKLDGREKAVSRVIPAGQGLFITDFAVDGADNGLIIDFQPALFNGLVHMADDILPKVVRRVHILIIITEGSGRMGVNGVVGGLGLIQHGHDALPVVERRKPALCDNGKVFTVAFQAVIHHFQAGFRLVLIAQDAELGTGDIADIAAGEALL